MNPVVEILIRRDGLSQKEAEHLVTMTQDEMLDGNPYEAEEILSNNLGLEPDYIFDVLYFEREE